MPNAAEDTPMTPGTLVGYYGKPLSSIFEANVHSTAILASFYGGEIYNSLQN